MYVNELNLIGTTEEMIKTTNYLKKKFEMKDIGKTKFCLSLLFKHFSNEVSVYQSTSITKMLKCFYMDKTHPLSFQWLSDHLT